jgi:hypothetical protein
LREKKSKNEFLRLNRNYDPSRSSATKNQQEDAGIIFLPNANAWVNDVDAMCTTVSPGYSGKLCWGNVCK